MYNIITQVLKNSQDSDQEIFQEILKYTKYHESQEDTDIYEKIIEDNHVLIEWKSFLDLKLKEEYKNTGLCGYSIAPEEFFIERVSLAFAKDMQWLDQFNTQ